MCFLYNTGVVPRGSVGAGRSIERSIERRLSEGRRKGSYDHLCVVLLCTVSYFIDESYQHLLEHCRDILHLELWTLIASYALSPIWDGVWVTSSLCEFAVSVDELVYGVGYQKRMCIFNSIPRTEEHVDFG